MEAEDRAEIRQILSDVMSGPLEKINGQYLVMANQLSNIEINTLKTNGTVKEHDKIIHDNLPRTTANCPQRETIDRLDKEAVTAQALKKATRNAIILTGTVFSILFIIFQVVTKFL